MTNMTDSESPSDIEKFVRWYEVPYRALKTHSDGDGAFVALSIGFLLFERYYRIVTNTQDVEIFDAARNKGAEELDVNKEFFSIFWSTYRNGLMHQGTPRIYERNGVKYKWMIDADFEAHPTYYDEGGYRYICLNPWKFTEFALEKFLNAPSRLNGSLTYKLGSIFDKDITPVRCRLADCYP